MSPLIFIFDGILPDYCFYSLEFSKKYSNKKIILLITKNNKKIPKEIEHYFIEDFYKEDLSKKITLTSYHKEFWNGFWIKTIERFFILESFCKKYNINRFFHAELDNIVFNIESLDIALDQFGKNFFFTKDRIERGLGGFVYINSLDILRNFCNFVLENLEKNFINDMYLLGKFSNTRSEQCAILPNELNIFQTDKISLKAIDSTKIGGIVDGTRIGEYLFGSDPRISKFMVFNKTEPKGDDNKTNFDYKNLLFYFSSSTKEFLVKHKISKKSVKIYNLHVHSKLFKKLSNERFFISILSKSNLNKRSLMTLNFKNILQGKLRGLKRRFQKFVSEKNKN